MSEYQYYEFLAIDRPLEPEDMAALRRITSRAEITPTRLTNVYHWGDFRGDPHALTAQYFDVFVYVANWGTRRLLVKLPRSAVDPKALERYVAEPALTAELGKEHVLLEILHDDEEGAGWVEDREAQGWMPSLAPLRAELLRGETTPLYLAWLRGATTGFAEPEEATEPPAPAGLRELSGPCRALCDFLALDPSLVAAAAEGSDAAAPPGARGSRPKPRTAAELLARAEALRAEREEREALAAKRTRAARARAKPAARKKLRSGR
jgi:hypothetical protein